MEFDNRLDHYAWEYHLSTDHMRQSAAGPFLFGPQADIHDFLKTFAAQQLIAAKDQSCFYQMFEQLAAGERMVSCQLSMDIKGRKRLVSITQICLEDQRIIGFAEDITALIEAKQHNQQEGNFRNAIAQDALACYEIDLANDLISDNLMSNSSVMLMDVGLMIPCSYTEFLSRWSTKHIHSKDRQRVVHELSIEHMQESYAAGHSELTCEYRTDTMTKQMVWVATTVHLLRLENGSLYGYAYIKDIEERKLEEIVLKQKSEIDPLTLLYNRYAAAMKIENYVAVNPTALCAFFMVDIDNFKEINDQLGHAFGDEVLKNIADKLKQIFKQSDILTRYGGDEFIIFLTNIPDKPYALQKASILAKELNLSYQCKLQDINITTSIGITFYPEQATTFEDMFHKSDAALCLAKQNGKHQYIVTDGTAGNLLEDTFINKEWLIDELEEIVYVSDLNTYELLYLNATGRKQTNVKLGEYEYKKCYELLQGRTSPCPFCTNTKLCHDQFYVWEYVNPHLNRRFIVKDKLVYWNDRSVRMEIAVDITRQENVLFDKGKYLIESTVLCCLQMLNNALTLKEAIHETLKIICEFYHGERSYIVEIDRENGIATNTYEWCQEGIGSQMQTLQSVPLEAIPYIFETFNKKEHLIISQIEEIKESYPSEYHFLKQRNARSLFAVPFEEEHTFSGYIGVDNPTTNHDTISLLESIAISIVNEMKKRRLYEQMEYQIYYDRLSGLLNHNSYSEYLQEHQQETMHQIGVLYADINGIKQINKDNGHTYGDAMIKTVATTMCRILPDAMIYRLSGDEFCIIQTDIDYLVFQEKLQLLQDALDVSTVYGVSLGYTWSENAADIERLIHQSEEAMIINKHLYYEKNNVTNKHHSTLRSNGLKELLAQRCFHMYLQPKYDAASEEIISCEALTRLIHPKHGYIPPNRFIPVLEKERLIHYLDFFMLEEACRTIQEWKDKGRKIVPISINFSRITLMERELFNELTKIKLQYKDITSYIMIEITESIGNLEKTIISSIGQKIVALGFTLSLDDFGADYANMSILSTMQFGELKLDKSMIDQLTTNNMNQIVVQGILDMCKKLHIQSVAEGVEHKEQLVLLRELGCDIIQGFYFSAPVPLDQFEKMLNHNELTVS